MSQWVQVPAVSMRPVAVYSRSEPDETMPSKNGDDQAQQKDRKEGGAIVAASTLFTTAVGRASLDTERLNFIGVDGHAVFRFPSYAKDLLRLRVVCVHMKQITHIGVVVATLRRLNEYSYILVSDGCPSRLP